jgi:threonine/homoserine/homoserine lactone efflux protein
MTLATISAFALIFGIGIVVPGPTMMLAFSNGARFGLVRAGWGMLGALAADILLMVTIGSGLGVVLATSPLLYDGLRVVGAVWIAVVGVQMLCGDKASPSEVTDASTGEDASRMRLFRRSLGAALANPKYYVFLISFLPQFVSTQGDLAIQYVILTVTMLVLDAMSMFAYASLGAMTVALNLQRTRVLLTRVCGITLIGVAAALVGEQWAT